MVQRPQQPCDLQVPSAGDRARPYRASASVMYTGDDPSTARAIARGLFSSTPRTNDARAVSTASAQLSADITAVSVARHVTSHSANRTCSPDSYPCMRCRCSALVAQDVARLHVNVLPAHLQSPPVVRGDMLPWLGFSLGTAVQSVSDYFFDEAFAPRSQVS